jgi:ubiquinone/menaquinone biosynthesis C-methylase UbiE
MDNAHEKSHLAHETLIESMVEKNRDKILSIIQNKESIGYKLNLISLNLLNPFLDNKEQWLTIGDYNGLEANYLEDKVGRVVASDISDAMLVAAQSEGLIKEYKKINVEAIDLPDNSFDYVLCREAFHHFPRAYQGLYEMIRVSKKATIMLEPLDILNRMPLLVMLKNICDWFHPFLIDKIWKNRFSWEYVGNFVFKISEREVEKMAMGIALPCVAFKPINILLETDVESKYNGLATVADKQKQYNRLMRKMWFRNLLCNLKLIPHNMLMCIIFKERPSEKCIADMKAMGYTFMDLPKNPFLK